MTAPQFVDLPNDGRSVYPRMLEAIRKADPKGGKWALLRTFDKVASSRDTTRRLKGVYPDFEFTSRLDDDGVKGTVYARYSG